VPNRSEWDHRYAVSEKGRESKRRYNRTAKGKSRQDRYNESDKGKERTEKYDSSMISVRIGGVPEIRYRVSPEKKAELQERLATFRQPQREERKDARIG
jgi:hypothetical protein